MPPFCADAVLVQPTKVTALKAPPARDPRGRRRLQIAGAPMPGSVAHVT